MQTVVQQCCKAQVGGPCSHSISARRVFAYAVPTRMSCSSSKSSSYAWSVGRVRRSLPLSGRVDAAPRVRSVAAFDPQGPGAAQLASSMVVLSSTLVTGFYWWLVVVPSERQRLGRDKRRGEVKEYLDEIEQDPSRKVERW